MATGDQPGCDQLSEWYPPDNSFVKRQIRQGQGHEYPEDGAACIVSMVWLKMEELLQFTITEEFWGYSLGENLEIQIGDGDTEMSSVIDKCLKSMKQGEISEISCRATADKDTGKIELVCVERQCKSDHMPEVSNIPIEVKLKLELVSFERNTPLWLLTPEEKIKRALHQKLKGTEWFKKGKIEFAFKRYSKSLKIFICMLPESLIPEDISAEYSEMRCHCYLNLAACQLKAQKWDFVIENCSKALKLQPSNVKALYRRGLAHMSLKQFEEAFSDLTKCLEAEPNNKTARRTLKEIETKLKEQNSNMAAGLSKMFASYPP